MKVNPRLFPRVRNLLGHDHLSSWARSALFPPTGRLRRLLIAVALGLLGYGLNLFPFRLSDWIRFQFGSVGHLLSAVVLGPWYGAISAALSSVAVPQGGETAHIVALTVLEAVTVGYLVRYLHLHLLTAAILSHVVTAPTTIFLGIGHNTDAAWIAVGQSAVSTVLGAGLLQWIMLVFHLTHRTSKHRGLQRTFRGHLYEGFTTLGVVMVLILTLMFARTISNRLTDEVEFRLGVAASTVGSAVNQYLSDHKQAIGMLAATVDETGAVWDIRRLKTWLKSFHKRYPGFLTVVSMDRNGKILATHPGGAIDRSVGVSSKNPDAANWPYFQEPKRTGQPCVSDAFRGDGITAGPLVAVSAPLRSDGGGFAGVVGGFLNLAQMGDFKRFNPGVQVAGIIILDRLNRVIFAEGQTPYKFLDDLSNSELIRGARRPGGVTTIQYPRKLSATSVSDAFLAAHSVVPEYGWNVFVEAPAQVVRQELLELYSHLAGWACVGVALCFLLAHVVAWRYTQPLQQLMDGISQLPATGTEETLKAEAGVPVEVARLIESFGGLSRRLAQADAERRSVLLNLEETVRVRTSELEEARARAEEASKAKSVFLATMSHEIRTPLNGVLGTISLLERTQLSAEQREYTAVGLQSAKSLLVILNDTLDFSKIEAGRLTLENLTFDLIGCLDSSVAPFRMQAQTKGLAIKTHWPSAPAFWVTGDSGRLRQVLSNLLGNAIKFTNSGTIEIEANWQLVSNQRVRVEVNVRDTGIGISEESRARLFRPFEQGNEFTVRQFGGTGLGLAISKQLVELMGGNIGAQSEPGKGSTFRFSVVLRLSRDAVSRSDADFGADPIEPTTFPGTKILLVEDTSVNRLVARRLLSKLGCQVVEARTGVEALRIWSEQDFDAVLMDCQMPEMDGYDATREIRSREMRNQRTPIVAMTANAMLGDREKCLAAGMDDFIAKPVDPAELSTVLSRVLNDAGPLGQQRGPATRQMRFASRENNS